MNEKERKAKLRAEMILKVRSGLITAKEASKILGVSRKTYYQWEKRGLEGLMGALAENAPGRKPKEVDTEKENLKKQNQALEGEVKLLRASLRIKEVMEEDVQDPVQLRRGRRSEKKRVGEKKL